MKIAAIAFLLLFGQTQPPLGYQCIGWMKPEAETIKEGSNPGESLFINISLTDAEKKHLYYARQAEDAAFRAEEELQDSIIRAHVPNAREKDDRIGLEDDCGQSIMIRSEEYHITHWVPANPKFPGDADNWWRMGEHLPSAAYCREYFAKLRLHAVTATYGPAPENNYRPKESQ